MHVAALSLAVGAAAAQTPASPFRELDPRSIGPAVMGGRIHDVTALPADPSTVYIASATGGLWKSTNHGTTWTPIFDHQSTATFGVVSIAPSNPEVLWAGTGEQNNRQSSSWGDGVFRSTNGGATWSHVGLENTRAIGRIAVDPLDGKPRPLRELLGEQSPYESGVGGELVVVHHRGVLAVAFTATG